MVVHTGSEAPRLPEVSPFERAAGTTSHLKQSATKVGGHGVFCFRRPACARRWRSHRLEGGGNGWRFGGHPQCRARLNVESRKRWMIWLNTPDPANDKKGKVVHLKPKPEQPA